MIRYINLGAAIIAIGASFALYKVKYQAGAEALRVQQLRNDIAVEKDTIAILKAEWSHLNRPERLQGLAERHLALEPVAPGKIVTLSELPRQLDRLVPVESQAGSQAGAPVRAPGEAP